MSRTRVKICGVRDVETALVAAECGADALGFVFVKASPRHVTPDQAEEIAAYLPPFVQTVGLFVNPSAQQMEEAAEACLFDFVQLHGNEPEPFVRECGGRVIKAVRFDPATIEADLMKWSRFSEVDAVLVDGGSGGEGQSFDWGALARVQGACEHPVILAGGLTPQNVGEAIRAVRPWAVDVSSGVESAPGVKDPALISAFCDAVRRADGER